MDSAHGTYSYLPNPCILLFVTCMPPRTLLCQTVCHILLLLLYPFAAPQAFADWVNVTIALEQAATGGVSSILLFQGDGSLLAAAKSDSSTSTSLSSKSSSGRGKDEVVSALLSSLWVEQRQMCASIPVPGVVLAASRNGSTSSGQLQELQSLLIDCDGGQYLISKLGPFLVAMQAESNTSAGLLNGKMLSLLHTLQPLTALFGRS